MLVPRAGGPEVFISTGNRSKKLSSRWTVDEQTLETVTKKVWELRTLSQFKPHEIDVVVKFFYTTSVTPTEISSSSSENDEFDLDNLDSIQTRRRSSKKRKKNKAPKGTQTASQRQRQSTANDRMIKDLIGNFITRLFDFHACRLKSCRFFGRACVAIAGYGHVQLTPPAVKKWNQMIRDSVAKIEECPAAVVDNLVQELNRTAARSKSQPKLSGGIDSHPTIVQYFGGAGGFATDKNVRSSPPECLGDDNKNMKRYLD